MAYAGNQQSKTEELQLMRAMIAEHGVNFSVGVAEDEHLQTIYGANGLPTVVLIDRQGMVRYAGPGGEDQGFDETLQRCLNQAV
jgi:thioredoxin-related protein